LSYDLSDVEVALSLDGRPLNDSIISVTRPAAGTNGV